LRLEVLPGRVIIEGDSMKAEIKVGRWSFFLDFAAAHRIFLATPLFTAAILVLFWKFGGEEIRKLIEFFAK
jgi:hypothetical protein